MFAPHDGENAQLGIARLAATKDGFGVGVFLRREVVLGYKLGGDGGFALQFQCWFGVTKTTLEDGVLPMRKQSRMEETLLMGKFGLLSRDHGLLHRQAVRRRFGCSGWPRWSLRES